MKHIALLVLAIYLISPVHAQLKVKAKCDAFFVDILDGKVNSVKPNFNSAQIKSKFPCFTSEDPETSKCGGVVYFRDRDVKFYTGRDYIEIGPGFKGKLSIPLMGSRRGSLFKVLGHPKLKDDTWDAFETQYGCLILYYNAASRVRMIRFSTKTTDEINLCE